MWHGLKKADDGREAMQKRIMGMFGRKKTRARVKIPVVLLCAAIAFSCFTTACQPAPVKQPVTGRVELYKKAAPLKLYQAPDSWQENLELQGSAIRVDINAKLSLPDAEAYPVYRSQKADFTQGQLDSLLAYFLKGRKVLENPEMTKGDYRELITKVKKDSMTDQGYLSADDFAAAITDRTRLICISHVAWNSGALLPVAEVCALAQERGIMVVVDGAQSAGQLQIDVRKLGCHFYSLPGHKWMMGPLGTGALYVRQDMISQLNTSRVGWASAAHDEENNFSLHASARRYEAGTIHSPAYAGWQAALEYVANIGSEQVFARILHLAQVARDIFRQVPGCAVLGPTNSAYWSGLLALRFADSDPKMLAEQLWQEKRIITRWIPQPYAFRLSLHAFVTEQEIEQVADAIAKR
jgi:hypothetical protein